MKKNLLYVLMMACLFSFFTACSDDDDEDGPTPTETTWKNATGTYKGGDGEAKKLTIDGKAPAEGQIVVLATGSGENAKLTLTKLIPEQDDVVIDNIQMKKESADYTFEGDTKVGTTNIAVKGKLTGVPATKATAASPIVLDITVTRTMDSSIAGTWKLGVTAEGETPTFDFRIDTDIQWPDPIGGLFPMVPGLVGGMIGQKVSTVEVVLNENGLFDVNWVKQGTTEKVNYKAAIKEAMKGNPNVNETVLALIEGFLNTVSYFTIDDKFYLTFNKGMVDLALPQMEKLLPKGLTAEDIIKTFEVKGDNYAIVINMEKKDNEVFFYMGKDKVIQILGIAEPFLGDLIEQIPENLRPMIEPLIEQLPALIAGSGKFNIGLGFTK